MTNTNFFGINLANYIQPNPELQKLPKLGSLENLVNNKNIDQLDYFSVLQNEKFYNKKINTLRAKQGIEVLKNIKQKRKLIQERRKLWNEFEAREYITSELRLFKKQIENQKEKEKIKIEEQIKNLTKEIESKEKYIKNLPEELNQKIAYLNIARFYDEIDMSFLQLTNNKKVKLNNLKTIDIQVPKFAIYPLEKEYMGIKIKALNDNDFEISITSSSIYYTQDKKRKEIQFYKGIGREIEKELRGNVFLELETQLDKLNIPNESIMQKVEEAKKHINGKFYLITEAKWDVNAAYERDPLIVFQSVETETWHFFDKFDTTPAEEAIYKTHVKSHQN